MTQWINACMAAWVAIWIDRLMQHGRITDWIGSFVDEWTIRCLDD